MSNVVNSIANPKGWRYNRRSYKVENAHGYNFRSLKKPNGKSYLCTIKAQNPIDAANRLNSLDTEIKQFLGDKNDETAN